MTTSLTSILEKNLDGLRTNPYPGRGIVLGIDETGKFAVQIYWIMGRSPNSQNRIFKADGMRIFTEAADESKVEDPSLIIYNAMGAEGQFFVVTNGAQTDDLIEHAHRSPATFSMDTVLQNWKYEPDAPNYTPRISGVTQVRNGNALSQLSILRRDILSDDGECEHFGYIYPDIQQGVGYCMTTYSGDGSPLPSFKGEPYPLPITGSVKDVLNTFWDALNPENRISLAVRFIHIKIKTSTTVIMNRFKKV